MMEYVHNIEWQQFIFGTDLSRWYWITVFVMGIYSKSSVKVDNKNDNETWMMEIR